MFTISSITILIVVAYLGGICINIVRHVELRRIPREKRDLITGDPLYSLQFFLIPAVGSIIVLVYVLGAVTMNSILAFHIGASAPAIMKAIAGELPPSQRRVN